MLKNSRYIALKTLVRKEIIRFLRIWSQTLLPSAITMTLYFIIFGHFVGSQLDNIHGYSFMQFLAPGLIMMAVVTNSYSNVAGSFFGSRFQREVDELIISPTPNYIILIGYIIGGILRGICVALIITAITLLFTKLEIKHPWVTLITIVLCSGLFSLAGFTNALYAKKFDDVAIVPTFVLTPLTYLGGVFYSLDLLPPFWYNVSLFNPILYMVNAFRYGLLGVSDINIQLALVITITCVLGLYVYNLYLLRKGVGIRS